MYTYLINAVNDLGDLLGLHGDRLWAQGLPGDVTDAESNTTAQSGPLLSGHEHAAWHAINTCNIQKQISVKK